MANTEIAPRLYTIDDVKVVLNVSRKTVERLVAEHQMRSIKVRGRRRIPHDAVDDYINQLEQAS
jgi:excisionase family DNA binding protein